jgi:hypothetical protein
MCLQAMCRMWVPEQEARAQAALLDFYGVGLPFQLVRGQSTAGYR